MSNFRLNLPLDIPWTRVDCSADTMDTTFCNRKYPPPFKTSIALYAYEPSVDDLPEELCNNKITYLKLSCSITGYQPDASEKERLINLLGKENEIDYSKVESIMSEYFGCYGVLLNVSVHPPGSLGDDIKQYPHIIDFEPKKRDFYQAASETGEILTSSIGKLNTGKSFSSTESTQSSWEAGATVEVPVKGATVGLNSKTGQARTETDQENWGINTDASRERREGQSTTTHLSQMYNLLTGYHAGTNRASFVMLPRPHTLQTTNRRTFTQGLRVIEGIQDVFLIVVRAKDQEELRVDALLQTGHFAESVSLTAPEVNTLTDTFSKTVNDTVTPEDGKALGFLWDIKERNEKTEIVTRDNPKLNEGFLIDEEIEIVEQIFDDDSESPASLDGEFTVGGGGLIQPTSVDKVNVNPRIQGQQLVIPYTIKCEADSSTKIHRKYIVTLKKEEQIISPTADSEHLLVTQRQLCTTIKFGDCIEKRWPLTPADVMNPVIVHELRLHLPIGAYPDSGDIDININSFGFKQALVEKIQHAMFTSGMFAPPVNGESGFLQTQFLQRRLLEILPPATLSSSIHALDFVSDEAKAELPEELSLQTLLTTSDFELSKQTGMSASKLGLLKRQILRVDAVVK